MFGRIITAMVTPFHESGEVNLSAARDLARHLASTGSDAIVVCSTTGEAPVLSEEEKLNLFRTVRQAVPAACNVIANVGSNSTTVSCKLAEKIADLGLNGVMAVVPYYNKPTQEGLYRHFREIAVRTSLPVMLYNVPGRTVVSLAPETVARLAEVPNIVALKEASASLDQMSGLKQVLPEDFAVYSGEDSLTLPMLAMGAVGVVGVSTHVVGLAMQRLISAFAIGNTDEALSWHNKLYPVFRDMFITTNPIPIKFILSEMGFAVGSCRLPLTGPTEEEKDRLRQTLEIINSLQ
jgi:4-hydroxy-tetrahydrodipicolinate synthase